MDIKKQKSNAPLLSVLSNKIKNQNTISYIPILSIADLGKIIFIHVRAHTQHLTGVGTTLPLPNRT